MTKRKSASAPATTVVEPVEEQAPEFSLHTVSKTIVEGFDTLVLLVNGAPVYREDTNSSVPEPEIHRGNTPWYCTIPALDLSFMLKKDGKPLVGYHEFNETVEGVVQFLDEISAVPGRFESFRKTSKEFADTVHAGAKIAPLVVTLPNSLLEFTI